MTIATRSSSAPLEPVRGARADTLTAVALLLAAFTLYAGTACRTVYVGDSPEIALAAATFGVPHPPGYPLHTLLSGMLVRLLPIGDVALRANLCAAAAGAGAVALVFRVARRFGGTRLGASVSALSLAGGLTFWSQAVAAEVYAFDALLFALALLQTLRAREQVSARGFVLAGICLGLLVGHRPIHLFELPGFVLLLESARRAHRRPLADVGRAVAAATATSLVYLYLPLASLRDPALDIGDPQTLAGFLDVVTASPYRRHLGAGGAAENFGRVGSFTAQLVFDVGPAALLGWLGLWRLADIGMSARWAGALLLAASVGFTAFYNILDIAPYWLPAHVLLAALAARALTVLPRVVTWLAGALALALVPLNFATNDLRAIDLAARHAHDALRDAEPGAILISGGDTSTHALWYLQAVARERQDVVVERNGLPPLWYARELARRHPEVAWPDAEEAERGTWFRTLLVRNLGRRAVYFMEWPAPRLQQWGAGDLAADWYGLPDGVRFQLMPAREPLRSEQLDRARRFWASAQPPTADQLRHQDVQVLMTAHAYAQARYAFACALLQVDDVAGAVPQLEALIAADPDAMEQRLIAAYASIGSPRQPAGRTQLARQALALRAQGADAMLRVLAAAF